MGQLRVSCAAFCRIEHEGRYLFLLNKERARGGRLVVTPVGGGLWHFDPPILREIGAIPERPDAHDLRFCIDGVNGTALALFRRWFYCRVEREIDPFRELHEELVEEQRILPAFGREHVRLKFAGVQERRSLSDRPGAMTPETQYFWEVFDVEIVSHDLLRRLLDADRRSGAFWLTPPEIAQATPLYWGRRRVDVELGCVLRPDDAKERGNAYRIPGR